MIVATRLNFGRARAFVVTAGRNGFIGFLQSIVRKVLHNYRANLYALDLTTFQQKTLDGHDLDLKVSNRDPENTIVWMEERGIPGLADPLEIRNLLEERHHVYTLTSFGTIAGYIKVGIGRVYLVDLGVAINLPNQSAFIMDTFIDLDFRGKKLFHFLISKVVLDLKERGCDRLYCHIRADNHISMSAYQRNGFRQIGRMSLRNFIFFRRLNLPFKLTSLDNNP